jgi:copper resistance protein B
MQSRRSFRSAAAVFAYVILSGHAQAQSMSEAPEMHEPLVGAVLIDTLEYRLQEEDDAVAWEADAWYGGDYNKLWLKTQGEYAMSDGFEEAEFQALYSRLLAYYWDIQAGLRYDVRPDPSRAYGVLGLQGLAPGYFELDLEGFVSEEGDLSARLEAEYDLLITQQLVLQPRAEINLAAQEVHELGVGEGVNNVELGLRLRYEFSRKFAPYIGVHWDKKLGNTADLAREEGEDASSVSFVTGLRFWF